MMFNFFFIAGLTTSVMKVLVSYWMYWNDFWIRNSKNTIFNYFKSENFNIRIIIVYFYVGKKILTRRISINLFSASKHL